MCGIVGVAASRSIRSEYGDGVFEKMRDTLYHRGPDFGGEWWSSDGQVGFGHRRLAIIDLSPSGRQPMLDSTKDLCIVFNGEIYNHVELRAELADKGHYFQTSSDTEVILIAYREWGYDCVSRLNGTFAFSIYDSRCKTIFLSRDRSGEKPLFYSTEKDKLVFASELKAILSLPSASKKIDKEALDCYLAMGFIPGDRCIVTGVNKLPPSHSLTFQIDTKQVHIWRYWQPPKLESELIYGCAEDQLLIELEELIEDSVRKQLVADVPVGILLSGGVDSSIVTAMAVRSVPKVKTFTIRFPGYGEYDESDHARLIANHFGTEHIELDAAETTADLLPLLASQFDEPIVDSSMIPTYLVSKLIREHCTVALGGDGGDELFGGYSHYSRLLWTQRKTRYLPRNLGNLASRFADSFLPLGFRGRVWLQSLECDLATDLPLLAAYFDPRSRKELMKNHGEWPIVAELIRKNRIPKTSDLLQRATRMDFENYLPEDILVKVDRASMLNSLEIRAPFLDYRIIDFAFGRVPSNLKTNTTNKKILLKRLTEKLLPKEFDRQRKQGFAIPLSDWLRSGSFRTLFREVLLDDGCIFNKNSVNELLNGQDIGRFNGERLFSLVIFELWRRQYQVTL